MSITDIAPSEDSAFPENDNGREQAAEVGKQNATHELSFPSPSSVKGRVLGDLLAGERITHATCWMRHGSSRLAHHVLRLRQSGWPIITQEVDAPTRDGRTARIAEYRLPAEAIAAAGESGRRFIADVAAARGQP